MAVVPRPPAFAPSSASSKLIALMSAPAPKASTRPTHCLGHRRAKASRTPSRSEEAASAPQPSAASMSAADRVLGEREADAGADCRDDPEAQHDLRFRPGHHLEVVMHRGHQQDSAAEHLEAQHLDGYRECLDHADAAEDDEE